MGCHLGKMQNGFEVRSENMGVGKLYVRVAGIIGIVVILSLFVHEVKGYQRILIFMLVESGSSQKVVYEFLVLETSALAESYFLNQGVGNLNHFVIAEVVKEDAATFNGVFK